jgi:NADH-quinone oxidoreductase subunit C
MAREIGTVEITMDALAERLGADFGDGLGDLRVQEPDTLVARVDRAALHDLAERLKGHELGYETLNFIAAVDHERHFETVYHVYSWHTNTWLELHVELPRAKPEVATVTDVWPAADWHEREAWDMMGIRFAGHPDLRRILLKDDFIGHPLRRDYVDRAENHPHV